MISSCSAPEKGPPLSLVDVVHCRATIAGNAEGSGQWLQAKWRPQALVYTEHT